MRDWILAGLVALAAAFVVKGVSEFSAGAAWIVAGVALAAWSFLVVTE